MNLGQGKFVFREVEEWAHLPDGMALVEVPGVAVDSQDRVYAFCRNDPPILVFDRDGHFLHSWGAGLIKRPHDIVVGPDDSIYCVDDFGHAMHRFTTQGERILTVETADHPSDTGYVWRQQPNVLRAGPPFNYPTGVALSPAGDLYVSDGYGNARVHKFSPDGRLLFSWGEPGTGEGQFVTPHNVCIDREGIVYVADRQNCRIQLFSPEGRFISQWPDVRWPCDMYIDGEDHMFVAELGGLFMGARKEPALDRPPPRLTVRSLAGTILSEWGMADPLGSGIYFSPHNIAVDSRGDLYVGEVGVSYPGGSAPATWPMLRKYVRLTP